MLSEASLIGIAWAILFVVVACMAPRALRGRRSPDREERPEIEFLDMGGPVIDAEPA
ncbi:MULTISPECIES: hypothetical protein [Methylobacterium]|uniref:CcoQ/FixQ family Cbb3-type cytochrome c oxidase assembly chaperone n=1 Tax=Methylobacterium jeotgali TaxID=381630 RepID=A0ABQ4ST47_9HYPH|nr:MULTISPECIES: hypothetical protein [Methylobacterium]GBU18449.1 hypothetical protein AwMethylo_26640 [Methylobacterium sp.]GJE04836.1 hypothetical protein AOPFMNJM_0128 [Methylobacterium jeotgali]